MHNNLLIILGKLFSHLIQTLNFGNGSTWPGHLALSTNKKFINDLLEKNPQLHVVIVAGTNGKTTTSAMIKTILAKNGKRVIQNVSGANLQNGIASTLLLSANISGKINADYAIFEVDENAFPQLTHELHPACVVLLNLFRDQLDRYGEVNTIAKNWKKTIGDIQTHTKLILNADDPQIAFLGQNTTLKTNYFGLSDASLSQKTMQHAADSQYCPNCGQKLVYKNIYYSHLGDWSCPHCKNKRPSLSLSSVSHYPLTGTYNKYNTLAAVLTIKQLLRLSDMEIISGLKDFKAAFGRQEIFQIGGKTVQIFLSKNPASMNESLRTIQELEGKHLLFVLNDRIPDGQDVSWIWDIDIEELLPRHSHIIMSGDRAYDMGLRMKYANKERSANLPAGKANGERQIEENLEDALKKALEILPEKETLYILPTYSAMLDIRKILTGRKIL